MIWADLVPAHIACRQVAWERMRSASRMKFAANMTFGEIGSRLGVSKQRAAALVGKFERERGESPVERWLRAGGEIAELAFGPHSIDPDR